MILLIRILIKIVKILCAFYLTIFSIGFIFPTHIRQNALYLYDAFSTTENIPPDVWVSGAAILFLIIWFGMKTLYKLFATKGSLKKFWDEI
jgi:uncharacterized BrkB/YihY/UPF0761 family membrane protein